MTTAPNQHKASAPKSKTGAGCRHLKIAGRVAWCTISSGYQGAVLKVATHSEKSVCTTAATEGKVG
jgi:hypothetical protein